MKTDFRESADALCEIIARYPDKTPINFFGETFHLGAFPEGEFQYVYGDLSRFLEFILRTFDKYKYLDMDMIKANIRPINELVGSVDGLSAILGDVHIFKHQECTHMSTIKEVINLVDRIHQADLMEARIQKYEAALRIIALSSIEIRRALGQSS